MNASKNISIAVAGLVVGAAVALLSPAIAHADAYGDLVKISTAFHQAKSYHAEEDFSNGRVNTIDFVAPDRWRLKEGDNMEDLIIGDDVYTVSKGSASKLPFGGFFIRRIVEKSWDRAINSSAVRESARDLGQQMLDGRSVHAYSFSYRDTPTTIYVDSDWLPVEAVSHSGGLTTTVRYSKYNTAISIEAP